MSDISTVLGEWRSSGIRYVRFELPDMHGISRSKTIPIDHAGDYAERGLNMYGGVRPRHALRRGRGNPLPRGARVRRPAPVPGPGHRGGPPVGRATGRFICDAQWHDGTPLAATPRYVFRRALDRCREMGFEPVLRFEFEFYLLTGDTHEPLYSGYHIFNTVRNAHVPTIRSILDAMPQVGVDIITSNCEYAGSQWEINFAPGRGLAGPDDAFTFKNGVKEIAAQRGVHCDVHVEALARLRGQRMPPAPLPGLARRRPERLRDADDRTACPTCAAASSPGSSIREGRSTP